MPYTTSNTMSRVIGSERLSKKYHGHSRFKRGASIHENVAVNTKMRVKHISASDERLGDSK